MQSDVTVDTNIDPETSSKTGLTGIDAAFLPTSSPQLQLEKPKEIKLPGATGDASGGFGSGEATGDRGALLQYARTALGVPYVWGGTSMAHGVDCSGFVQAVYKKFGVTLPRISAQQARSGRRVDLGALRPGDLVAWDHNSRNNGADHIAIYIGGGKIIEAPHTGANVRIRTLGRRENAWGVDMSKYL